MVPVGDHSQPLVVSTRLVSLTSAQHNPPKLSVSTFETLRKIRANLNYHVHSTKAANAQPGINMDVAKNLEESFTWVPPLAISLDEIDAMFTAFEQEVSMEQQESISMGQGVLEGAVYSFHELDRVDVGIVPWALDEETGTSS
ncbi:hypothetical protein V8E55_009646 [Tylopilus felleus]